MGSEKKATSTFEFSLPDQSKKKARLKLNVHSKDLPEDATGRLPEGTVTLSGKNALAVNVSKLAKGLMRDQRAKMVSSDGCISNPGGPSC
jgi:hypothetical protein